MEQMKRMHLSVDVGTASAFSVIRRSKKKQNFIPYKKNTRYICARYDEVSVSFIHRIRNLPAGWIFFQDLRQAGTQYIPYRRLAVWGRDRLPYFRSQTRQERNRRRKDPSFTSRHRQHRPFLLRTNRLSLQAVEVPSYPLRPGSELLPEEKETFFSPPNLSDRYSSEYYIFQLKRILI